MDSEKEFINMLRYNGYVKGVRPFICNIAKTSNAFGDVSHKYIISYRDDEIYFQSLNYFSEIPNNKNDYTVKVEDLRSYTYVVLNDKLVSFSLITKRKRNINLLIMKNVKKRVHSQISFNDFIDYLKEHGINDEDEKDRQTD